MAQRQSDRVSEAALKIQQALQVNLGLQKELHQKMVSLSNAKLVNRKRYLELTKSLDKPLFESKVDADLLQRFADDQKHSTKSWTNAYDGKIRTRRFFVDPENSEPDMNDDTVRRRGWEGNLTSAIANRFVPFSKLEIQLLKKYAEDIRLKQQSHLRELLGDNNLIIKDEDIDFEAVAKAIAVELKSKKLTHFQKAAQDLHSYSQLVPSNPDGCECRPWIDYRIKYLCSFSPSINHSPITKQESLTILEALHRHDGNPPWDELARDLSNGRTPFQCFRHAQIKLSNSMSKDTNINDFFTEEEDELLFKFIAASGPQFVMDIHSATLMSQKLFRKASVSKILFRVNVTSLSPSFTLEKWTDDEERILALAMKVFSKTEKKFSRIAELFPNRTYKSITDKWNRSLDPSYSSIPFSKQEDTDLLVAVQNRGNSNINWKEISQQFPSRKPEVLFKRWAAIAPVDEVMNVKKQFLLQRGVKSVGRTSRIDETEGDVLDSEDLVLVFKKRKI